MARSRKIPKAKAPLPGTSVWRSLVTASKVPAIVGTSPFDSPYSMWQKMKHPAGEEVGENPRFIWGHIAEKSVMEFWRWLNPGWRVSQQVTYENTALKFPHVATLDAVVTAPDKTRKIVEIKTTGSSEGWGRPGEADAVPDHYRDQVLFQMLVSGIHEAEIVRLFIGHPEVYPVMWDPERAAYLADKCEEFHLSLVAGFEPDLDASKATLEAVQARYQRVPGEAREVAVSLVEEFLGAKAAREAAAAREREAKARLLQASQEAEQIQVAGQTVIKRDARGALRIQK